MTSKSRVAIVIPWFGRDQKGGAELHAWQLATRLAARHHDVEVLTTCCRGHAEDWETNHLPAGPSAEAGAEGFAVTRFKVVRRERVRFEQANGRLLTVARSELRAGVPPVDAEDERVFCEELIRSPALLEHLAKHKEDYDAFILLPYLYGPVIEGTHLVADRALLQPCLHDEAYAYLPTVARAVYAARRLLFLSEGEQQLAVRLYGPGIIGKSILAGAGVDVDAAEPDDSLLPGLGGGRFVLCLGRKTPGKKTDFLARCFLRHKREHPESRLQLVIAGPGHVDLPPDCPGLVDLGVVSEAQKRSLLRHCAALFHPSENESYSRVIMEAWLEGRPAAANSNCLATATALARGGGWLAATADEWTALFATIDAAPGAQLDAIGASGRQYASELASWDAVIERYERAIEAIGQASAHAPPGRDGATLPVHQVLPLMTAGEAVCGHALWIRSALRRLGHPSEIFAIGIDPALSAQVRPFTPACLLPDDAVIYHHATSSPVTPAVIAHPGPKCFAYHDVTPHHFLEPYSPLHARLGRQAREELPKLASHFPLSVCASASGAAELAQAGFPSPGVLPASVEPARWQRVPDADLMTRLQDGRTNVLFVGRPSPEKRLEDLVFAFMKLRDRDDSARLVLAATGATANDLYVDCLKQLCRDLGVEDAVEFIDHAGEGELAACYRTAHLFWSMSEHEDCCGPLVEAMWFDVPVFAFAASAIPETMAGAGCLFPSKDDPSRLAAQALQLARNPAVREEVIEGQRSRRVAFLDASVSRRLEELVTKLR